MAGSSTLTWSKNLTLQSTLSPFTSPLPITHPAFKDVQPCSWKRYNISGILLTIYGLSELPAEVGEVACLWLLHGRGDTQDSMSFVASAFLQAWQRNRTPGQRHLICVTFDQRNHGSRLIHNPSNESWKAGNPTHAPDMYNTYSGTAHDVSLLITHLPAYLPFTPTQHLCGGVSLGGHATWHVLLHDPRVSAGLVVIGCPDYQRLMTDRAIRSNLLSCTSTSPPGRDFLGSSDFPRSLLEAVEQHDPAALLMGELNTVTADDHLHPPSESEIKRIYPLMRDKLGGKHIFTCSGGKDRLVPYEQAEPFLGWLKRAIDPKDGWFRDRGTTLVDVVDQDARHEFSSLMRNEAEKWLCDVLAGSSGQVEGRESRL